MSKTMNVAKAFYAAGSAWQSTGDIALASGLDGKLASAFIGNLRKDGLIETRATDTREREHRQKSAAAMAAYIEKKSGEGDPLPDVLDEPGQPKIEHRKGNRADVPMLATLADALLGSATPHPYVPAKRDSDDTPREALAQHEEPTRTTEQPATPGPAERDGEPIPAKETKPAIARSALTWAIDHRGKLILCLGDNAFELLPPQWTPLARFLAPLAGVFV